MIALSQRLTGGKVVELVTLLEHQRCLIGPDDVAPEAVGPLRDFVLGGVEDRPVVGAPRRPSRCARSASADNSPVRRSFTRNVY